MSNVLLEAEASASTDPNPNTASPARAPWIWAAFACLLLSGSGMLRGAQENRRQGERIFREHCPIALSGLPKTMGNWEVKAGGEERLDDLTMRISGGTDHIIRAYANKLTGVSLSFLLLYGPAEPVTPHTPEVCYPSSGFSASDKAMDRMIAFEAPGTSGGKPVESLAQFRGASYAKSTIREVVYHSFRLDGKWSNHVESKRKLLRRNPAVFKLQVQRRVGDRESIGEGEPIEDFLATLLTEIESELAAAGRAAPPKAR